MFKKTVIRIIIILGFFTFLGVFFQVFDSKTLKPGKNNPIPKMAISKYV